MLVADCFDGSDESSAACAGTSCAALQFACAASRRCIPAAWRCDGARDCGPSDPSDELDCGECAAPRLYPRLAPTPRYTSRALRVAEQQECTDMMYRCASGGCVPWEYYCDGRADCSDASEERGCPAPPAPPPSPRPHPAHAPHTNTL